MGEKLDQLLGELKHKRVKEWEPKDKTLKGVEARLFLLEKAFLDVSQIALKLQAKVETQEQAIAGLVKIAIAETLNKEQEERGTEAAVTLAKQMVAELRKREKAN